MAVTDVGQFATLLLVAGVVGLAAIVSNKLTALIRVPAPGLFLVGAGAAAMLAPRLGVVFSSRDVTRVVSAALIFILFDGGMRIGRTRFRSAAAPVLSLGLAGTFLTAGLTILAARYVLGFSWPISAVLATAVAPTDPAVVFSILGKREVVGRTATILEGESGANDPVGISLMIGVLAFTTGRGASIWTIPGTFALQMVVGTAIGVVCAALLLPFMRKVTLPSEGLYPLRTAVAAVIIYAAATLAHGSGFVAVLTAGILLGDERAPYKAEIERYHASLAALAEIVIFIVLGLTVDVDTLAQPRVWVSGIVLAVLLTFVIRPLAVGPLLWPVRLTTGERLFVMWGGLKGAVPILLGAFAVVADVDAAAAVYGIVVIVVACSVLGQGAATPGVARLLGVPMQMVRPEPWDVSVRLAHEPRGVLRCTVAARSGADGTPIGELPLGEDAWICLVVRHGRIVHIRRDAILTAGDELLVLHESAEHESLRRLFETAGADPPPRPDAR